MSHALQQYEFNSALAISHVITHNRNTLSPNVTVINNTTNKVIVPADVFVLNANQVQIDFFVATDIRGKVE